MLIDTQDVRKIYRVGEVEVTALDGVSFRVEKGEFVAIMGASGSGKSTLMNILGCLDQPTSGRYSLEGQEVSGMSAGELARVRNKRIGFVFQSFNLLPRTSALENVELPLMYGAPQAWAARREIALRMIERLGLRDRLNHHPGQLSGGQQQRVAIARALVNEPSLILADEPTGNLDSRTSKEIMDLFSQLNSEGMTIIMVTHEDDIARYSGRIVHMRDGKFA